VISLSSKKLQTKPEPIPVPLPDSLQRLQSKHDEAARKSEERRIKEAEKAALRCKKKQERRMARLAKGLRKLISMCIRGVHYSFAHGDTPSYGGGTKLYGRKYLPLDYVRQVMGTVKSEYDVQGKWNVSMNLDDSEDSFSIRVAVMPR
jgi:hypothetical protein